MNTTMQITSRSPAQILRRLLLVLLLAGLLFGFKGGSATQAYERQGANVHIPETAPRPGEVRLSQMRYKASHNSYERGESIDQQIDKWNVWMVELDIFWDEDQSDVGKVTVEHYCGSPHNAQSLAWELREAKEASIQSYRPTIIYLDMKDPPGGDTCYQDWPYTLVYMDEVRKIINNILGESNIYKAEDFKDVDKLKWPSWQELQRRGKRWIVILDTVAAGLDEQDSKYFFGHWSGGNIFTSSVLINSGNSWDKPFYDLGSSGRDRWLYRLYPSWGDCGVFGETKTYWNNGVKENKYTFTATNCINKEYTMESPTHSPMPLYVNLTGSGNQFGTLANPYFGSAGLQNAIVRVSSGVPLFIHPGSYDVPDGYLSPLGKGFTLQKKPGTTGEVIIR